jgi:molecular chaperone DnaJ
MNHYDMNHYDTLRVTSGASDAELHEAYRSLARRLHPDAPGGNEQKMAQLNEAWRVLGDPGRRAMYDAERRGTVGSVRGQPASPRASRFDAASTESARPYAGEIGRGPRRWPAISLMLVATMAAIFVFTAYATNVHSGDVPPFSSPRVLDADMCVNVQGGSIVETPCNRPHYGVVKSVIARDARCPAGTEGHYSNDGEHYVCISTAA